MKNMFLATVLTATALATVPAVARGRDRDRGNDREAMVVSPNQVVDIADARIAALKADLRLTPDQDKNWGSFQSALHDMAQRRADRMAKTREQRSSQTDLARPAGTDTANPPPRDDRDTRRDDRAASDRPTVDLPTELRNQADAMSNKADDLRKFADASGPLYSSLDDTQRQRFLGFVRMSVNDDPEGRMPDSRRGRW